MSATKTFHDTPSVPLFAAIAAAFAFVTDVIRDTLRLRAKMARTYGETD